MDYQFDEKRKAYLPSVFSILNSDPGPFLAECRECNLQTKDWDVIVKHCNLHRISHIPICMLHLEDKRKSVSCAACKRKFLNLAALSQHAWTQHCFSGTSVCPFCGKTFSSPCRLQHHMDTTYVTFKCPVCKKFCNQEFLHYQHLVACLRKSQPTFNALVCDLCHRVISTNDLPVHMTRHSGRAVKLPSNVDDLPVCANEDIDPGGLSGNQSESYQSDGDDRNPYPFLCEVCDQHFEIYFDLRKHLLDHGNSRIHSCSVCGAYFSKKALKSHLVKHHNLSPHAVSEAILLKRSCCSCKLVGFRSELLLMRHYILRCPNRTPQQQGFGDTIISTAKKHKFSFAEALESPAIWSHLETGKLAFHSIPVVEMFIKRVEQNLDGSRPMPVHKQEDYTDLELLAWLDQFESIYKNGKYDNKDVTEMFTRRTDVKKGKDLLSQVHSQVFDMSSETQVNSKTPGVVSLPDIDFQRIVQFNSEMYNAMDHRYLAELQSAGISDDDVRRIELEAQEMRQLQPFYIIDPTDDGKDLTSSISKSVEDTVQFLKDPKNIQKSLLETTKLLGYIDEVCSKDLTPS